MLRVVNDLSEGGLPNPAAAFEDWLEAEGGARMIIERSARVVWTNARGRRILADGSCLTLSGGHLAAAHRSRQTELQTFIDNLAGGPEVAVIMGGDTAKPPIVVIGCSLRLDSGDYIGLRLRQISDSPRMLVADLTPAYKLTATERQVVRRLIEGETAEAISRGQGQSIDTVRTHIRNIYSKIGVSSREALFARVYQYLFWID